MMKRLLPGLTAGFLTLALLSASLLALTGCNTTAGIGKDIEAAGEAINKKAEKNKKY